MKLFQCAAVVGLALFGSTAMAESDAPWWQGLSLGAMGTYLEPSDVREARSEIAGFETFVGVPLRNYPGWSAQLSFAWNELERNDATGQDELYQLGLDVLRHFQLDRPLQTFVVAGLAAAYEEIAGDELTRPSLGLGIGLDWQPGSAPFSLRAQARAVTQENDYELNGRPTSGRTLIVDGRFGLGALWTFGQSEGPASAMADADADGVADDADLCPDTLPNAIVDRTGCESLASKDSDGDGVSDALDRCPGTPPGDEVDAEGCGDQAAVVLKGVNFGVDSDQLSPQAEALLNSAAQLLTGSLAGIRIEIAGHTDASGDADYNQALSARRAYAVKQYLVEQGVAASRLVATGYGSQRPVADNATEAGRAKNRRVVFRVLD